MRIIYMGTPDFAVPALDALAKAGHDIVAVYSQPPRPAGRGKNLTPSPVHQRAEAMGIEVRTPESLKDAAVQAAFAALDADVAVVAAYGLILPRAILDAPRHGCMNIHASLLPRWRGAAPIQRAILSGDNVTGVTIMDMAAGLDTGPMRAKYVTKIEGKTAGALTAELAQAGADLMVEVLDDVAQHPPMAQPDEGVTYAAKIAKAEARIDFTRPALQIERQVRAFNPFPGAFFEYGGERFRILMAQVEHEDGAPGALLDDALLIACGHGAIRPTLIQRAGKAAMTPDEMLRGFDMPAGSRVDG
ncbi:MULTISPECIES: methionyl-tRNA formyltransferase [unclassified Sphingobium]|uniref:methionyl-tRNA formyltransferase n=1 Tax=unclassified Sphingobium TaxID=2611147 RepID=UPI000D174BCE|nr:MULTISPECIES: methionyl-tRNA formyltransferase [unclassified Sphingobium]MBG6119405.1 methionyl-tRNA formyltransferase [Sphingobium sp. JAI105]PSO10968.1 methionyl-tRNA formyltransferase [Sphingobium sp. AEW4]TWD04766.1 methionyl-tRNA formyltransferase [Sphingobium sp. AEW010]TWD22174.1 methionyl-tRNA formyltransferase [Sphingobium sp. AEW013]TWD24663.1 methionyl-tRNA formyltransferase [Sphingobium sp. AEW001]